MSYRNFYSKCGIETASTSACAFYASGDYLAFFFSFSAYSFIFLILSPLFKTLSVNA